MRGDDSTLVISVIGIPSDSMASGADFSLAYQDVSPILPRHVLLWHQRRAVENDLIYREQIDLMEDIALRMFLRDRTFVTFDEVADNVKDYFQKRLDYEQESVKTARAQERLLLQRVEVTSNCDTIAALEFGHLAFRDYFLAKKLLKVWRSDGVRAVLQYVQDQTVYDDTFAFL